MKLHELREEYHASAFTEEQAGEDPKALFKQWFEFAKTNGQVEPNAFTLSSVDSKGFPDSRIVLLKEVMEEGYVFYTNYTSQKAKNLETHPMVCMNFWWSVGFRQVRIKGKAVKVSEEQSATYFAGRPKGSQIGAHASDQSSVLETRRIMELRFERLDKQFQKEEVVPKPKDWGGYLIVPQYYEFWQGQENRLHDRIIFELDETNDWVKYRLWP